MDTRFNLTFVNNQLNAVKANQTIGKRGKDGFIKASSWLGRSITVGNTRLNRGSLIDYLNAKRTTNPLKKGWFFGLLGGSSNEEIINATIDILTQNPPPSGGGQGQNTVPKASVGRQCKIPPFLH